MYAFLIVMHVIVSLLLLVVILLQSGKSAGLGGLLGSGSDSVFSVPSGTAFLRKVTAGLAAGFMLTSLLLTYTAARQGMKSVVRPFPVQQQQAPVQPPK